MTKVTNNTRMQSDTVYRMSGENGVKHQVESEHEMEKADNFIQEPIASTLQKKNFEILI